MTIPDNDKCNGCPRKPSSTKYQCYNSWFVIGFVHSFIIYEKYNVCIYTWRIHTMMVPAYELAIEPLITAKTVSVQSGV